MPASYDFVQLDVFTRMPLAGNPLAIFTDAPGLTDKQMQALAREMNLSETTFVLPREREVEAINGKRVRIFTTREELPFAGHPTLGTALYLYSTTDTAPDEIVLDLNVGKIPVRFTADSTRARDNRAEGDVFGEMRQRDPEFGAILRLEDVARAIGIDAREIASEWPTQVVSTGLSYAIVPFRTLQTLACLEFNFAQAAKFLESAGTRFFYLVCPERRQHSLGVHARMFFYGGEDPATGSAAGCASGWMVRYGVANSDEQVLICQGVEIGRPSEIFVRAKRKGDRVTNISVGGRAVELLLGTITL